MNARKVLRACMNARNVFRACMLAMMFAYFVVIPACMLLR